MISAPVPATLVPLPARIVGAEKPCMGTDELSQLNSGTTTDKNNNNCCCLKLLGFEVACHAAIEEGK